MARDYRHCFTLYNAACMAAEESEGGHHCPQPGGLGGSISQLKTPELAPALWRPVDF